MFHTIKNQLNFVFLRLQNLHRFRELLL